MKKFKLFALTALLAMGTNAFADINTYAKYGGLRYGYDAAVASGAGETGAKDNPFSVKVEGAIDALGSDKAITIPASFSKTNEDDKTTYFKVVGFSAKWSKQNDNADGTKYKDITGLTKLTINIDNISAFTDAFADLEKLEELVIIDGSKTPAITDFTTVGVTPAVKKSLKTLDIEEMAGVKVLSDNLFKVSKDVYENLTSVTLPKALTEIGISTFDKTKVTTIALPKTVTKLWAQAFQNSEITTVTIPEESALAVIGNYAFTGCKKLEGIDFSNAEKLTTIGLEAFAGSGLKSITIPETVEGDAANQKVFENCEALTTAIVNLKTNKLDNCWFRGCTALENITLGENIKMIGGQAFKGCEKLKNVTISSKDFYAIQNNAFEGCEALESLDLSTTKFTFDTYTNQFKGCTALAEIKLPETTTSLPDNIFADCPIVELNAPNVATIGTTIFGAATEEKPNTTLKTLVLGDLTVDLDGFAYFTALEEVTIGTIAGGSEIKTNAFANCGKLTTFTMTDGAVAANAFLNCTGLKTFNYIDKVPGIADGDIDTDAFLGCTAFVQIVTTATFQSEHAKVHGNAPHQTKWATSANSTMKTVADAGTSGKAFGIFENTSDADIIVPAAEGINFYSIYVDEGTAYFQALRKFDGKYIIAPDAHVVIKTDAARDNIEYTSKSASGNNSALVDEVITLNWGGDIYFGFGPETEYTVADFQSTYMDEGEYLYRLTNKASTGGFGFTYYAGTKMNAGQFFIVSTKKPAAAAGRLNMIWLDENGNVESDATAIETVKQAVNDDVIYNMAGQQVDGNYKGIVIKNGKKVILK